MDKFIAILDIIAAIGVVLTLNLVQKYNKAWLGYALAAFGFTLVMWHARLPGMILMGIVLTITGIKNYTKGRKDE